MSSKVVLFTILTSFFVSVVHSRGNIFLGQPNELNLIYKETHEKTGMPLYKRSEDVVVSGVEQELIRGIVVQDLRGNGLAFIEDGGIGQPSVRIHLQTNVRGEGYKFLVNVYAS